MKRDIQRLLAAIIDLAAMVISTLSAFGLMYSDSWEMRSIAMCLVYLLGRDALKEMAKDR